MSARSYFGVRRFSGTSSLPFFWLVRRSIGETRAHWFGSAPNMAELPRVAVKRARSMKVYLDDQRPAPNGWTLARNADEAIALLRKGTVTELSLDYDLGDPYFGTGLDVLDWLERALAERRVTLPRLTAHSGSMVGRRRLETSIALLEERWGRAD